MATTTENTYVGTGSTTLYSFTFPYIEVSDVYVSIDGIDQTITTEYSFANATTISFVTAPVAGSAVRIYRQTDSEDLVSVFFPGSAIRAKDLNDNFVQNLYVTQESVTSSTIATNAAKGAEVAAQSAATSAAGAAQSAATAQSAAQGAASTANSAVVTANSAVVTANSAVVTANSAVSTAGDANDKADAAIVAISDIIRYDIIPDVSAIPTSPADREAVRIIDSTGIESFTPLTALPSGFVGDPGIYVQIGWVAAISTWVYQQYAANDPDDRYGVGSPWRLTGDDVYPTNSTDNVLVGGTLPSAPNIALNASGSINFNGILTGNFTDYYAPLGNITKAAFLRGDTVLFTGQNGNNYYGHFDTAGDLKIGGTAGAHKISLNADGSAMFTGGVTTSTRFTGTSVAISAPGAAGNKTAWISASNSAAFYVSDDDNGGATTVTIGWNGSATFAGNTTIGPFNLGSTAASGFHFVKQGLQYVQRPASSPNEPVYQAFKGTTNTITLTCDGSASFAGAISSNRSAGNVWEGYQSSSITSQINANGSATFAGDVVVSANTNIKLYAAGLIEVGNPTASATVWGGFIPGGNYTSRILADGSATYAGTVTATVVPPSDARFKENITPANPQLADVVALGKQLKNFDWNDKAPLNDELRSVRQLGLIAQEAEKVCPGLIKTIQRTKQGEELTPEEIIPAVVEPAYTIPAVTEEIPDPDNEGEVLTVEVTPAQEVPERVVTPEKVIPATYEELDDSYKGISTDVLIMKLLGAVAELQDQINTLKNA